MTQRGTSQDTWQRQDLWNFGKHHPWENERLCVQSINCIQVDELKGIPKRRS